MGVSRSLFTEHNLDPALAEAVEAVSDEHLLEGILRLEDPFQFPPHFTVVSRFDRISTGRFPAARTWEIRRHPNVVSLKAARPLGIHEGNDGIFSGEPRAGHAPEGESSAPFTGRGCLVAALDFGLDFAHPNFLNPDGSTRLASFWHQGATYDPARPNRFGYGRIYSPEEINAALRAPDPYEALGYHPGISDTGKGSHGTHTLDIAAGNGRARGARRGVAPDARLLFVHISTPRLGDTGDLGDSVRLLEALDFVEKTARAVPWVANLSLGRTAGSHDGTSLVEQGMHELLRSGPGRAIVQSAGNYRSADLAVEGWLRDGEERDLDWIIDPRDTTANELDLWYSGKDRFFVAIRAPGETAFVKVALGDVADIVLKGATVGRIYHRENDPNNRDNHVEVFLYTGARSGVWTVRLIGDYVISGRFHAWIERDLARPGAQSRFDPKATSQRYTLGTIATSPLVVTVGAYDANVEARAPAHFSSRGPTRDDRKDKPELLAPGVDVLAARSIPRGSARQEGLLVARSGTSMAAPHVTGTVAAMFEAAGRPISIHEIRICLERSAEPLVDDPQHDYCAWGRLNSAEAIRRIRGETPEKSVSVHATFAGGSEEDDAGVASEEGATMSMASEDELLTRAQAALRMVSGGRRRSESVGQADDADWLETLESDDQADEDWGERDIFDERAPYADAESEEEEAESGEAEPEQEVPIPSDIAEFARRLGAEWAARVTHAQSAEKEAENLLQDYRNTLEGARRRFKKRYGSGKYTPEAIGRAWMISRQEELRFRSASSAGIQPVRGFAAPALGSVTLVSSELIHGSDKAPVAPLVVQFVEHLRQRHPAFLDVSNYRGHGGQGFNNRGHSLDLFIRGLDPRGFYSHDAAMRLLRAVHEAAHAVEADWRVIYNDFSVADAMNRATGRRNVIFVGKPSRDGGKVAGLNWHGPDPLILHFHLDLAPRAGRPSGRDTLATQTQATSRPAAAAIAQPADELVRFAQRVLNAVQGERLAVDGALGPLTRGALRRFRAQHSLGADGVLDQKTELALAHRALEEIAQQSLFAQPGVADAKSDEALRSFKAARGLGADATLDAATRSALAAALERRRAPSAAASTAGAAATDWARVPADQRMAHVVRLLVERHGYPVNGAAGIVGNLWEESGVLPNRVEGSRAATPMRALSASKVMTDFTPAQVMNLVAGQGPLKPGIGLAQWTSAARRAGLFRHRYQGQVLGESILHNMDAQVDYLVSELRSKYRRVDAVLRKPDISLEAASDEVVYSFEVPGSILTRERPRKRLPRDDSAVQEVFRRRRASSRRALRAYTALPEAPVPGESVEDVPRATSSRNRREIESVFLRELLRGLGHDVPAPALSPARLFQSLLYNRSLPTRIREALQVIATPGMPPREQLRAGDWMLRAIPGADDVGHVAVLASDDLRTPGAFGAEGIMAESARPGRYGVVIEPGVYSRSRSRRFARRLLDARGGAPLHTLLLRPRQPEPSAPEVPPDSSPDESTISFDLPEADTPEESISVDDVAGEMKGLRCRFLSAYQATRADGSARAFAAGALLPVDDWNGTRAEATIAGFGVPKLVLAPAPESASGVRRYDVALDAQRRAVTRNARALADWLAREGEYRRNHATWEREKARLDGSLGRRRTTYSRMWVRQMMYNRFDVAIASWVANYNAQLTPAAPLDPNVVKSLLYQESRMGTSGAHLMPPPSDWSSSDRHPIRSRYNIGQAIDSWGPQQWLMMREMAATIFSRHGLSAFERTWQSMSNDDYAAHAPFIRALREFFEFRDGSNRNLMGTTGCDLHEDYGFWIRTAVRWLFVKYANLRTPTWTEAVRAYNGSGARARAYRDAVMARVGGTDAYAAESLEQAETEEDDGAAVQEEAPQLDTSATLTWEDLSRVRDSAGQQQLFYLVTGAPASRARAGDEGKAIFHLRVRNTNSVYNHKNVTTKYRVLDVLRDRQYREVMPWRASSGPDLEDESSRVIRLSLGRETLRAAYNPDSPLTRLEVEYHWRETWESAQKHYNRTGLDFMLVAPIEFLFGRKQRISPRDVELNDPAQHKANYWIPVAGVNFTEDIRQPVTIQLDVMSSVSGSAAAQQTATSGQTRSTTRTSSVANTFSLQLSGEVSQGGSAKASIEVLELGVQEMFKLGGQLGYSRTRTDTTSTTVASEFIRSLMLSRTYATSQAVTTRTTLTVSPPEIPQPRGTGRRTPRVRTVGVGSVGVYLYPLIAFFDVPYVRFDNANALGQATRRTEGHVAVPFVTEWRLTSHRGG